jgi:hypothetical protein
MIVSVFGTFQATGSWDSSEDFLQFGKRGKQKQKRMTKFPIGKVCAGLDS